MSDTRQARAEAPSKVQPQMVVAIAGEKWREVAQNRAQAVPGDHFCQQVRHGMGITPAVVVGQLDTELMRQNHKQAPPIRLKLGALRANESER